MPLSVTLFGLLRTGAQLTPPLPLTNLVGHRGQAEDVTSLA